MRFIRGDSLKEAIGNSTPRRRKTVRPRPPVAGAAQAVARFTDVCNAIDYAHSRGCCTGTSSRRT